MPNSSAYQPAAVRDGLPMPERRLAMVVIVLGIFVAVLDGSIMNLALPTVAKSLAVTPSEAIWVVNAYQLGTLGLLLPLAALGERIGYRKVYLVGMVCFTLASAVAMLANSFWVLVLARGLQGMGAAGVMAVNAALVRLTYPASKLGKGMALNSLVVAVASVTGPGVAALILSVASWQWLFAINVPLGLLTLWLGRRALPGNPQQLLDAPHAKLTPTDVLLNFAMFALVFLGAERVGARHDAAVSSAASGWLMLGLGLALGGWYVLRQRRLALPLLPLDLLRIPVFALSMGASVGAFTAQMLSFIALPFLLLDALHRSHFAAGMLMTAWSVAIVVVAPVAGKLIGRVADGLLGGIGMAILALGLLSLGFLPADPSDPASAPLPCLTIRLGRTKTTSADDDRFAVIAGRPVEALKAWLAAARIEAGPVFRSIDRWGNLDGKALSAQTINAIVKKRAGLAGIEPGKVSAHGLRSGYLTEAARQGVSLPEAMAQSQHRSVQQAARYYDEAGRRTGKAVRL